ncbi:MAG: histidine--tRNA ligase [DPANN group archaeon]|nr:histidine--tRNA ligase [DPANN group archaeon]
MPIETVKGFKDILPPDSLKRQKVREIIEKNFKLFGFVPIETPTIEYEELVRGDNPNDSAVSDRFRLKDRGGRELALRFEFTFQLKRIFKENPNIKLPFRRYQVGYVFRDEPVERNRYREFIQCDADIVGDASIKADAECLALADKICKDLKIKYTLKFNNRKLVNSILANLKITDKENVLRELDKLGKAGEAEVKKSLTKYASKEQINKLFKTLNNKIDFFVKQKFSGADKVAELLRLCKLYKLKAEFSPFLMRGLAYYTGSVFEGYATEIKGSLFAGGRYDNSVGRYVNRQIPAVGISFGRLLDYPNIKPETTKCIIVSIGQDRKSIEAANKLRASGISCFVIDRLSKALEYANVNQIPYAIFVGGDEVKAKKVKLRDMKTGREKLLSVSDVTKKIK